MSEEWKVPFFYMIDPEEAESCGLAPVRWYAMAASLGEQTFTQITTSVEALQIIAEREQRGEEAIAWALSKFLIVANTPAEWKVAVEP